VAVAARWSQGQALPTCDAIVMTYAYLIGRSRTGLPGRGPALLALWRGEARPKHPITAEDHCSTMHEGV
jgi:hypothetical protein